ncbi:hypothetical protein GLOIN_2v1652683 [Rhizophagus irregularis DAOM 181602=DAOM 197198]|uniref:Uncharacterized protein n=1 Tax=Rhizophagus irregularis (strain DAOM 181602 / DAOM 197198 / MUCL 43194) TaxID=747089 RepID=A0A2P4PNK0_RHIID|nr:hypothetical protein GLOIN_2v1652683 [Rhizophagus irregularis DAOM 181602=DAOM 197198]POG66963.1 hypothetical protein GLOIN_2v1652683 [Rhizophagus irregularis DAOM 181602=DAOM 197198]GET54060.1 hypothetical protein GLOIN_2v1652683 [Rhizophagus irregularis DAOM 181602=DAOM 197198]|eukprot:XP_025173829.1 hypothetical protein GLOIN_2v1652683 [Rhizophagus irregularis DAOM 181602=DAOM 197198]
MLFYTLLILLFQQLMKINGWASYLHYASYVDFYYSNRLFFFFFFLSSYFGLDSFSSSIRQCLVLIYK